eukprot:669791-Rhodomonas_salina.1
MATFGGVVNWHYASFFAGIFTASTDSIPRGTVPGPEKNRPVWPRNSSKTRKSTQANTYLGPPPPQRFE